MTTLCSSPRCLAEVPSQDEGGIEGFVFVGEQENRGGDGDQNVAVQDQAAGVQGDVDGYGLIVGQADESGAQVAGSEALAWCRTVT